MTSLEGNFLAAKLIRRMEIESKRRCIACLLCPTITETYTLRTCTVDHNTVSSKKY